MVLRGASVSNPFTLLSVIRLVEGMAHSEWVQWRIQGEIPGCHGSPLSVYSYVALVQLLASYLSVFVAIVV